ncbi:hypothetical protein M3G15_09645 [Paenibacillus sp. p3-SID1389]|uniref:hypothetical protein n=1 Tax=Paenibacillus sp. p3-SID1389 TaxID=2916364 RepID=UPI0021A46989|nr:hypothetical protein [Paenibacillus sp. p3-SID1389]MCT2195403.1 hypothetical protein [Paenibacillus sp. p3-SID1389]
MNNEKKIYVLLSNPTTLVAKMIGLYTRAPYNHASIAFDPELREVYSFGRKHPFIPIFGGFVREDIHSGVFEKATCAVYSCKVSAENYMRMRNFVKTFEDNDELYTYNFLGLLGIILNMELDGKNSFFCSQFVSRVFQEAGVNLLEKSAGLTTPSDLCGCPHLQLEFRGRLDTYRERYCYSRRTAAAYEQSRYYAAN